MRNKITKKNKTNLLSGASAFALRGIRPLPSERRAGRFMRAEEGHGEGGGGAPAGADGGADGAAAAAPAAGAGEGGEAGAGAEGAGAAGAGGAAAAETVLGEAAADADGAEAKPEGEAEVKPEGEEGAEAKIEVLGAPEKYEIVVPPDLAEAGMTFDAEAFAAVEPELRALDLSNEAAQALVGAYATKVLPLLEARAGERMDQQGADMKAGWLADAKADPEIGGAKFDETKALCKQTLIKFGLKGNSPFLTLLEESGLGNHPDMLRVMSNIGRATGEAAVLQDGGGKQAARLADRVYGKPLAPE